MEGYDDVSDTDGGNRNEIIVSWGGDKPLDSTQNNVVDESPLGLITDCVREDIEWTTAMTGCQF